MLNAFKALFLTSKRPLGAISFLLRTAMLAHYPETVPHDNDGKISIIANQKSYQSHVSEQVARHIAHLGV